jgi:hypothetical protein
MRYHRKVPHVSTGVIVKKLIQPDACLCDRFLTNCLQQMSPTAVADAIGNKKQAAELSAFAALTADNRANCHHRPRNSDDHAQRWRGRVPDLDKCTLDNPAKCTSGRPQVNSRRTVHATASAKNAAVRMKNSRSTFGSMTMIPFPSAGAYAAGHRRDVARSSTAASRWLTPKICRDATTVATRHRGERPPPKPAAHPLVA